MTLLEYGEHILVIDAGMSFPNEQMPGIDYVIPDYNYLIQNKEKVCGIVVTHGRRPYRSVAVLVKEIKALYTVQISLALVNINWTRQK